MGRHKKNCTCEMCLKKYPERREILEKKKQKSVFEYEEKKPVETMEIETTKVETPKVETPPENITVKSFDTVDSMLNEYNESAQISNEVESFEISKGSESPTPAETKYIIKGKMLLFLLDSILPFGIVLVYNKIRGKKIEPSKIKLTSDEKDELEHLADEVAKTIGGTGSPLMTLTVSMALIYTMNLIALDE